MKSHIRCRSNIHIRDFSGDCVFTLEFNVKNADWSGLSDECGEHETVSGEFVNRYGQECFEAISKRMNKCSLFWKIKDWSFAGRMNGWFVLICEGDVDKVTLRQEEKMEEIVLDFFIGFNKHLLEWYGDRNVVPD